MSWHDGVHTDKWGYLHREREREKERERERETERENEREKGKKYMDKMNESCDVSNSYLCHHAAKRAIHV